MTNKDSFTDTKFWIESIKKQCTNGPLLVLVGNKKNQKDKTAITKEMALEQAKIYNIPQFQVSANDQTSIESLLDYIAEHVLNSNVQSPATNDKLSN
jgi:GTPase SAR1 family protein